jgi:hypothetical protein
MALSAGGKNPVSELIDGIYLYTYIPLTNAFLDEPPPTLV